MIPLSRRPSAVRTATLLSLLASLLAGGCSRNQAPVTGAGDAGKVSGMQGIESTPAGTLEDGRKVTRYDLTNANGVSVSILDLGGIVTHVRVPDRNGDFENINLHYDDVQRYVGASPYFGALIGRYGNRIAGGQFSLDGETYTLATNNGPNHLHGGEVGFDKHLWSAEPVETLRGPSLRLNYVSPDGEEGYPSTLDVTVVYTLTNDDELKIEYFARNIGDKPTVVNLTQHSYWNLSGAGDGTILDHQLTLNADRYLPVDETSIPIGELRPVEGTPFDFTSEHTIGERVDEIPGGGYDHCYVINGEPGTLRPVARVEDPDSGRVMEIESTEPGVQLYVGVFLDGTEATGGYPRYGGMCLETQHFPDSPNQPDFPSTRLNPGQTYTSTTVHKFTVAK